MKNIEQITHNFYQCMSFEKGEKPCPEKLHHLFVENGILINYTGGEPEHLTVTDFITSFKSNIEKHAFFSLKGRELSNKTELFGRIAQRLSVYEFRSNARVSFGVAMIQLIQIPNKQWRIASMVWEDENEEYQSARDYLQKHSYQSFLIANRGTLAQELSHISR